MAEHTESTSPATSAGTPASARAVAPETLGQLSGQIAHDINNMLAVTLTSVEIASRVDDLKKAREFLETAVKMIGLQRELTNRLGQISRTCESPTVLDAHAAVRRLGEELAASADGPRLALELDAARSVVRCDEKFLADALRNVARNALASMPDGGTLTIATRNANGAELRMEQGREYLVIELADTGAGMPESIRSHAFDLFFSAGGGFGLGLAQARDTVVRAGGFATIASVPGSGTKVTLALPLAS